MRVTISEVTHELFIHQASWCPQMPLKKVLENLFLMFEHGKTWKRAKTHLPSMSVFSQPYLFWRTVGTQCHSAKFLNWGNHVNSVPDLAPAPLTRGIYCLIHVHNYMKIKGLDLEKITSCQNVFNLHASFQSLPKINGMLKTYLHTLKVVMVLIPSFHGLR